MGGGKGLYKLSRDFYYNYYEKGYWAIIMPQEPLNKNYTSKNKLSRDSN